MIGCQAASLPQKIRSEETIVVIVSVTIVILERAFLELTPGARPEHGKGVDDRVPGGISATENQIGGDNCGDCERDNCHLGEGVPRVDPWCEARTRQRSG